ncbi:MAG: PAS domain S-box protein, partial [Verrucomicrobia bacterium]|jgi:PAS domain S-box-containing protein|nr:PAS domain S-box protein [Verrucomicrobiota bacterium]
MSSIHADIKRHAGLYETLLNAIPSSVLLVSQDLRIALASGNFLEKSRRTEEQTLGKRLPEVFPPGILDHTELVRRIQSVFDTNEPTVGEKITYRAPGGLMRVYYYRVLPLPDRDKVEFAILIMEDVTEQERLSADIRRTERHLSIVVESASETILSTDPRGRILSWNQSAEQISGYASQEVEGRWLWEFCTPDHQADVRQLFSGQKEGKVAQRLEWNLATKSGKQVPISWICSTMMDDQGKIIGNVAVGRDLTESRKLQAQLLQAQKLAALGVMGGGIAHELRNPLAICSSAAQFLMREEITPEFRRECASKVQQGTERASAIIEHLLKFTRPSEWSKLAKCDLLVVLRETLDSTADQARLQAIDLTAQLPDAPIFVHGDSHLLHQVFMNLHLNAMQSMPSGGRLQVIATTNPHQVSVQVIDTGCGILAADLDKIYDPFYTKSLDKKGVGLGLPLCYAIVKQHAGSIDVDSTPGQGSTFTVRLPLSQD